MRWRGHHEAWRRERERLLTVARQKVIEAGLQNRVSFHTGDIVHLPFDNDEFDVVLSTYSMCPLYGAQKGALELYRVTKPGGKLGVAHSTEPRNRIAKWLSDRVEDWAWHFPWLSMGCRSVDVLPTLESADGKVLFSRNIGVPLWPCEIVWSEVRANFPQDEAFSEAMGLLGIQFDPLRRGAAEHAGRLWREYRRRGAPKKSVVPGFLIGAYALHQADALLSRDRGFYRPYITDLSLVDPSTAAKAPGR